MIFLVIALLQWFYNGFTHVSPTFLYYQAMQLEMDWIDTRYLRWVEMVRYRNRLVHMQDDRIPKIIYNWDKSLGTRAWVSQVKHVIQYANMEGEKEGEDIHVDTDVLKASLLRQNRLKWWQSAMSLTKLRTRKSF